MGVAAGRQAKPIPVVQSPFNGLDAQFSPDGKWIAYQSDELGQFEIYLQPFPGPGRKERLSTSGGTQVRWRRDGRELFYVALDGRPMVVPLTWPPNGAAPKAGSPVSLFATRVGGAVQGESWQQYMVSPDGRRFLMSMVTDAGVSAPINVLVNWRAE